MAELNLKREESKVAEIKLFEIPELNLYEEEVGIVQLFGRENMLKKIEYLVQRFDEKKFDVCKTVMKTVYGTVDFAPKEYRSKVQMISSSILILENAEYIEVIKECPNCGEPVPYSIPNLCRNCNYRFFEDWVNNGINKSFWPKKLFRLSQKALDEYLEYRKTLMCKHRDYFKKGLIQSLNGIILSIKKLRKTAEKIKRNDFLKGRDFNIKFVQNELSKIAYHMRVINKFHFRFSQMNSQIPWQPFIIIGNLIEKRKKWNMISARAWSLINNDLLELIKGISHNNVKKYLETLYLK